MKNLIVLTGAGISAESGVKTFRDHDGLWNNYRVEDVATYDAWLNNPELVQDFYNHRRVELEDVQPNRAHIILHELEKHFNVKIITQNVDDLHERAGSTSILHLHGELTKVRSVDDKYEILDIGYKKIKMGDKSPKGGQLRPHIVWFGEAVPEIENAARIMQTADLVLVVGTSLQVYPAAGLIHYSPARIPFFYVDPRAEQISGVSNLTIVQDKAVGGMEKLKAILIDKYA